MSAKKYLVAAIGLNAALLAWAAFRTPECETQSSVNPRSGKFGPVMQAVLPAAKGDSSVDILGLESGRTLLQPPFDYFNGRAEAIMDWIRSNRLDISSFTWSNGAACVTYDMIVVPVEGVCWDKTTEQDLRGNPALAPASHSPRRLLVLGHDRPDTYMFRTAEGALGMLRLAGVESNKRGVKIRYKLISR